jgi:hypothetical protein
MTASKCSSTASHGRSRCTVVATSNVGSIASSSAVTTPSAPSATRCASSDSDAASDPDPDTCATSPDARTTSSPTTACASEGFRTPEPCVPVATAPAVEMCGRDARFPSAQPRASRPAATCACVMPAATRTVRRSVSMSSTGGRSPSETWTASVSAIALNECVDPSAVRRGVDATSTCSDATVVGRSRADARYATFPAQLVRCSAITSVIVRSLRTRGPGGARSAGTGPRRGSRGASCARR